MCPYAPSASCDLLPSHTCRNGATFVEAQMQGLVYHSDLNEDYEGEWVGAWRPGLTPSWSRPWP